MKQETSDLINDFPVRKCFVDGKPIDYHVDGFHSYNILGSNIKETRDNLDYWCCRDHTLLQEASSLGRRLTPEEKLFIKGFNFLYEGEIEICTGSPWPVQQEHELRLDRDGKCMRCGRPLERVVLDIRFESLQAYAKDGQPTYIFPQDAEWWAERLLTKEEFEA